MAGGNVSLTSAAATNVGNVRKVNEDALLAAFPVYLVADGMGGHAVGDVASQAALSVFKPLVGRPDVTSEEVNDLARQAQQQVTALANSHLGGAGTTLTGLILVKNPGQRAKWMVLNIGDSRTYRLAGGQLEQVTVDHSVVEEMVAQGQITREQARTHPERNVITKALGDGDGQVVLAETELASGEVFLITSDGLTNDIDEGELAAVLGDGTPAKDRVVELINKSLAQGARDNITAIVVDTGMAAPAPGAPLVPYQMEDPADVTLPSGRAASD